MENEKNVFLSGAAHLKQRPCSEPPKFISGVLNA
jgi:hypothetical protein